MSTATLDRTQRPVGTVSAGTSGINFARLVRSEWIKFWSLRSAWWTLGMTVAVMAGLALIMAFTIDDAVGAGIGADEAALTTITFGYFFAQIVVAVLGALIITGEYTTGMIRSTFTADPQRLGAVAAKAVVLAVVVFVTTLIGIALSWAVTAPILSGSDIAADFSDPQTWRVILGTAAYLALVALMAFALGLILRSSAGTIAAALGILLVIPMVLNILMNFGQEWASDVYSYLPGAAGERLMAFADAGFSDPDTTSLSWWQGGLVLLGYVGVLFGVGLALIQKRDA